VNDAKDARKSLRDGDVHVWLTRPEDVASARLESYVSLMTREEAERCGMYFVTNRWLGGMMTNFQTIRKSIDRLKSITAMQEDGSINQYKKKEILMMTKEAVKLERNLGGIIVIDFIDMKKPAHRQQVLSSV